MSKYHPLRRIGKAGDYLFNYGTSGQPYQERARDAAEKDRKRRRLEAQRALAKRRRTADKLNYREGQQPSMPPRPNRKMIPYTSKQMQDLHRVTVAGMKNRKIMRKGPS